MFIYLKYFIKYLFESYDILLEHCLQTVYTCEKTVKDLRNAF